MQGSSGNGKPGTLRERFAHNQAERERAIAALEGSEWDDEITENHIEVLPGATLIVDQSGKHAAVRASQPDPDDVVTKTDHAVPVRGSSWPERFSGALQPLLHGLTPLQRAAILLALIGVLALAVWRGGAGFKLWP